MIVLTDRGRKLRGREERPAKAGGNLLELTKSTERESGEDR